MGSLAPEMHLSDCAVTNHECVNAAAGLTAAATEIMIIRRTHNTPMQYSEVIMLTASLNRAHLSFPYKEEIAVTDGSSRKLQGGQMSGREEEHYLLRAEGAPLRAYELNCLMFRLRQ